jgi:hypothetical protein
LNGWRVITSSDKWREIKASALRWSPRQRGADRETFYRTLGSYWLGAAAVLHFDSDLELFFREQNRDFDTLREADTCSVPPAKLAIDKDVHRSLNEMWEVVRNQESEFA